MCGLRSTPKTHRLHLRKGVKGLFGNYYWLWMRVGQIYTVYSIAQPSLSSVLWRQTETITRFHAQKTCRILYPLPGFNLYVSLRPASTWDPEPTALKWGPKFITSRFGKHKILESHLILLSCEGTFLVSGRVFWLFHLSRSKINWPNPRSDLYPQGSITTRSDPSRLESHPFQKAFSLVARFRRLLQVPES